ncbi:MAG: deoxyribonuclease IV [Thermaerobacter sp.]|nr:deoxyribonuclease IV [Thermaerobacter sp.]
MIRLGAQISHIRGFDTAIREAGSAGLQCLQVFSRSPVGGQGRELPRSGSLKPVMDQAGIDVLFVHAPYFVNPAAVEQNKRERAHTVLKQEMRRAKRLSAQWVVLHPGHWSKAGDRQEAISAFKETIACMLSAPGRVLIENSAGQGRELGADLEELGRIFSALGKSRRVGLMLDTAHAMAAGYPLVTRDDVRALLEEIERYIGAARVAALHLNDSWYPVGARRDRHAHLFDGHLGPEALTHLLEWADRQMLAVVLETPGRDVTARADDIETVRRWAPPA